MLELYAAGGGRGAALVTELR